MIILTVSVEISDQMNTSKEIVLGVFDSKEKLFEAKQTAANVFYNKRHHFKEIDAELNEIIL